MAVLSSSSSYCARASEYTLFIISFKVLPSISSSDVESVIVTIIDPFSFVGKFSLGFRIISPSELVK